ncbi:MAG: hypothetical protein ACRBCK_05345 [Alphaproteobacteria bacterium]
MGQPHLSDIKVFLADDNFQDIIIPEDTSVVSPDGILIPKGDVIYPYDDNILVAGSVHDIPDFGNNFYKGGVYEDAIPEFVKHEILSMTMEQRNLIAGRIMPINSATGHVDFTDDFKNTFTDGFLEYIDSVAQEFNQVGEWDAEFFIQKHLSARQLAPSYHPDSWSGSDIRQVRAFASISDTIEGQRHETEVLMTDGLTTQQVRNTFKHIGAHTNLHELYNGRVRLMKSGDILMLKGLGDGKIDILHDALVHRGPPHKITYEEEGKTRDTLIWQRHIEFEPDMG